MNSDFQTDRRLAGRYRVKTPLRARIWKSAMPERNAESVYSVPTRNLFGEDRAPEKDAANRKSRRISRIVSLWYEKNEIWEART